MRLLQVVRRLRCVMLRHQTYRAFDGPKLYLRCFCCDWQSPGLALDLNCREVSR